MRRIVLLLGALGAMIAVAGVGRLGQSKLLSLDWAWKASMPVPPVSILIEMGLKDGGAGDWSGRAVVRGATVVHREGYAFRPGDKLIDPDAWHASSHRPIGLPRANPALARMEGIAKIGVVLQLADLKPDARLALHVENREPQEVSLDEVLSGKARQLWDGAAQIRRISTATPVVMEKTEDDFPAAAYGPDGTLWLAYISYRLRDESRRASQHPLDRQPSDFKSFYTPEFADQLFVKYYRNGKWSAPIEITGPSEDLVRCAVAVEGNGVVWVIYSANRQGGHDLHARPIAAKFDAGGAGGEEPKPGPEERLTKGAGGVGPVAITDQQGRVWVACQRWSGAPGGSIQLLRCAAGKWSDPVGAVQSQGRCWYPALAAAPDGTVAQAFDSYTPGDYDVAARIFRDKEDEQPLSVAATPHFEARPSAVYDAAGRLWIAHEEGPARWGKDYGALVPDAGNPLYNTRSVRVICFENGKPLEPVARLPQSVSRLREPNERGLRYAYPKIGLDGKGRIWLTYRQKFGTRNSTQLGSYWLTFARRLDGEHWSEPIELHHSDGLLDSRPVLLPHPGGGLLVIHNTDGRFTIPHAIDNQIFASIVDLPGDPVPPRLEAFVSEGRAGDAEATVRERAAVKRCRDYRVEVAGKKYQLLRGEFHRHTEISWDGGPDGSLEDMFRYARDAADLDWIANTDHDNGGGREYSWWLTQKLTDAYHVPGVFTPLFAYERSVVYPHGHRNCVFAKRGVRTLPRLAEADPQARVAGINALDTKMLYRYLKEMDGICASHTSATQMGTDWRDNDPAVEPVVEIYQGDRNSYEYQGAPRAGYSPRSRKRPVQIGGWEPFGFIDLALKKGYRLGFQSSSDHWSTHISFCTVLAERHDRAAILDALRKRHCYGATDNIIVDVRGGGHVMGDEFQVHEPPAIEIAVIGTGPLARIHILRDSEVAETISPTGSEYTGRWIDPHPSAGVHYYYVRVEQADGALAWASPMWIDWVK